jgi:hypothetical protein
MQDELLKLLAEEPSISVLVLGSSDKAEGPGPLITALTGKYATKMPIPMMIVPGSLSDEEVDAIT